ncbi:MAG: sigma-70 family RNA polymerase sigma factor [Bacteroidota bacterium]|nr:sigma-70 family RNA polymerase sigma factor [Bacteroidota bacterium]
MVSEIDMLRGCVEKNSRSQQELYRLFAPKMFGVCMRYAKNKMEAEDILQEGFIKVFSNINKFKNEGSFEGWIRRTFINTAINHYKKNLRYARELDVDGFEIENNGDMKVIEKLSMDEISSKIQELPEGYRVVFNLNVIEGYTHKMIGQMLGVSENTSKSQLLRAKRILRDKLIQYRNGAE